MASRPPTIPPSFNFSTGSIEKLLSKSIIMEHGEISGLEYPTQPTDAATKQYVDDHAAGPNPVFNTVTATEMYSDIIQTDVLTSNSITTNLVTGLDLPTQPTDAASKEYVDSSTSGGIQYQITVQKNPTESQFSSIKDALDSILDSSEEKPYLVYVGPGVYIEDQMIIPNFVSIRGSSILPTVVSPSNPAQYLFIMGNTTEISFITLQGVSGSLAPGPGEGYSAILAQDVGDFAQLHKVSIYDFDIGIKNVSDSDESDLYLEYVDINGNYSYACYNESNNGFSAYLSIENVFTYPSNSSVQTAIFNDGDNTKLEINASNFTGTSTSTGISMINGGLVTISSCYFYTFETGILSNNTGSGVNLIINSCSMIDCTLDFSIENAGTTGYFFGDSIKPKYFIEPNSSFFIAGQDRKVIRVSTSGGDYSSISEAIDSISDSSMSNQYVITIGPGFYTEIDTIELKEGINLIGYSSGTTIIAKVTPGGVIMNGHDGAWVQNILLMSLTPGDSTIGLLYEGLGGSPYTMKNCIFLCDYPVKVDSTVNNQPVISFFSGCSFYGNVFTGFELVSDTQENRSVISNVNHYAEPSEELTIFFDLLGRHTRTNILNVISTINQVHINNSTGVRIREGAEAYIISSKFKYYDTTIHVPPGNTYPPEIKATGVILENSVNYDILVEDSTTIGTFQGIYTYSKISIPLNCEFYIFGQDTRIITVQKAGGDFTSIAEAFDSITGNSITERFVVKVGSGTFTEPVITMKPYTSLIGAGRATVISPDDTNHHIILTSDYSEIDSVILNGAGENYAAIYHNSTIGAINTSVICRNILFGNNHIQCWARGETNPSNIILFSCRYGGTAVFTTGFLSESIGGVASSIKIMSSLTQDFTPPIPNRVFYALGTGAKLEINSHSSIYEGVAEPDTVFLEITDGAKAVISSCVIRGFDTGILCSNNGTGPDLIVIGSTIDCNTDINIQHPDTTGSIDASADRHKINVNPSSAVSFLILDPSESGIIFQGPFYYSTTSYADITDISALIMNTPPLGVISGGELSFASDFDVFINSGVGYVSILGVIKKVEWISGSIYINPNSNLYICVNSDGGFLFLSNYPSTTEYILLGKASTNNSQVIYIQQIPFQSEHYNNHLDLTFQDAIGPIYSSGSSVVSLPGRELEVSQGVYFFKSLKFTPAGDSPVTFDYYYRSITPGIYTGVVNQTVIPNDVYDDGSGTLANISAGQFVKHLLLLLGGDGTLGSEFYVLIIGQEEFVSQGLAEAGGLPITPSFVSDAFVNVASIVVEQGNASIVSIIDERPRIGFASSSVTGTVTVHGDLLGLSANDHPQYLLVDGSSGMTGNLELNNNDILNPGLYNGFDVSAHASRHAFNGADPLTPAASLDISEISDTVSSAGTSNDKIPRADHVHAHGNRGGGNLHSAASTLSAGFMSASDKSKLDGISPGATSTPLSNTAPVDITKSAASAGVSTEAARQDHKHNISTASAVSLTTTSVNSEGTATSLARSDHTHAISSDVVITQTPDNSNAAGNSGSFAKADHIHNIPTGIAADLNANSVSAIGAAALFARSNHTHAIASGVPSNQTIAASVSAGTSANFARADHIHTFTTGTPSTISTANSEGVATSFARSDHIHSHGNQLGDLLHTPASTVSAGFMSASDKSKLNGIANGATNTPLSNTAPVDITKSAASAGVSTKAARQDHKHNISTASAVSLTTTSVNSEGTATSLARSDHTHAITTGTPSTISTANSEGVATSFARSDHIHSHGDQLGGTLHADVTTSISGFMSASDKTKLDGIQANATNNSSQIAQSTTTATTTSTTNVDMTGITITPTAGAGNYIVMFSAQGMGSTVASGGGTITVLLRNNGTDLTNTETVVRATTTSSNTFDVTSIFFVTYVTGALQMRWRTSGGTATINRRVLYTSKLG